MDTPATLSEASKEVTKWFWKNYDRLPEPVATSLEPFMALNKSAVEAVARTAEVIFAWREKLRKEDREMGAALALYCEANGFFLMDRDGRGTRIARTLRGEVKSGPDPLPEYS